MAQIQKIEIFKTADGTIFNSKQEALDYERIPAVKSALAALPGATVELVTWLFENQEDILGCYAAAKIPKVSKQDRKQLATELKAVTSPFVMANLDAIVTSFKYPTRARVKPEEVEGIVKQAFIDLTTDDDGKGNDGLVDWLLKSRDLLAAAYEAGVEKRPINEAAKSGLAEYQAAKKAATEAGPEALAAFKKEMAEKAAAKKAAEKAAREAAKAAKE